VLDRGADDAVDLGFSLEVVLAGGLKPAKSCISAGGVVIAKQSRPWVPV
jgi:hypothetical protein